MINYLSSLLTYRYTLGVEKRYLVMGCALNRGYRLDNPTIQEPIKERREVFLKNRVLPPSDHPKFKKPKRASIS